MATLKSFDVSITAAFVGLVPDESEASNRKPKDERQHVFQWIVTIGYQGRVYTSDYRAGIAHCTRSANEWRKGVAKHYGSNGPECIHVPVTRAIARVLKPYGALSVSDCEGVVYPTPPTVVGYLECLQSDSRAGENLIFEDFCSEFGYDADSRKAERIWRACQETRGRMMRLFGADFDAFMSATEDE